MSRPAQAVAAPRPAAVAAAPAAPSVPPREFEATRALAVRLFTDMVGPMAEALAIKMERARSPDELRTLVQTAQRIIGNARGGQAAAEYGTRFLGSPGS
jgi:imidazolonepropionase-like amidohydrolase